MPGAIDNCRKTAKFQIVCTINCEDEAFDWSSNDKESGN